MRTSNILGGSVQVGLLRLLIAAVIILGGVSWVQALNTPPPGAIPLTVLNGSFELPVLAPGVTNSTTDPTSWSQLGADAGTANSVLSGLPDLDGPQAGYFGP